MARVRRFGPWVVALLGACAAAGLILNAGVGSGGGGATGGGGLAGGAAAPRARAGTAGGQRGPKGALAGSRPAELKGLSGADMPSHAPFPGLEVIKTADIRVSVGRHFRAAWRNALAVTSRLDGFAVSKVLDGRDANSGTLVVRVPAGGFEQAVRALEGLGRVRHEDISGQDVTKDYVDLTARLRNATAQEAVLLRLMKRAQTIGDSIRVERELEDVQLTIETFRGQLRYLQDQTAMSTITLRLGAAKPAAPVPASTLGSAWERSTRVFLAVVAALIVGAGFVLPLAALILAGVIVVRLLRPRIAS